MEGSEVTNESIFVSRATLALIVLAVALAAPSPSGGAIVFHQDFETGLGPDEVVSGAFQINNTSVLNNTIRASVARRYLATPAPRGGGRPDSHALATRGRMPR